MQVDAVSKYGIFSLVHVIAKNRWPVVLSQQNKPYVVPLHATSATSVS